MIRYEIYHDLKAAAVRSMHQKLEFMHPKLLIICHIWIDILPVRNRVRTTRITLYEGLAARMPGNSGQPEIIHTKG